MNTLKFNYENIKLKVVGNVEESLSELQATINICQDLYIPRGFAYYSYLANLKRNIENIRNDLKSVNEWIDDSNSKINKAISEINSDIDIIEEIELQKNDNFIKITSN